MRVAQHGPQAQTTAANNGDFPPLLLKLLAKRGLQTPRSIQEFLCPHLNGLKHPSSMKNIDQAANLVCDAVENGTEIVIWGDYDVDGTTGTALLINFFRELGIEARYHIPNRLTDGYGLDGQRFIDHYLGDGVDILLITVDCGISDWRQVKKIKEQGAEVIVTDHHHLPPGELPDCITINPSQPECGFHQEKPAGVGVAFFLAAAVRYRLAERGFFQERKQPNLKKYLSFVALGTISDLVELTSTNRLLVKAGLESLSTTELPGLQILLEKSGVFSQNITSEDIGFLLGPRINAAGRLGSAEAAVDLMICDNVGEGKRLADKLESFNEKRKALCEKSFESALTIVDSNLSSCRFSTVIEGDFHSGIIGIVAARLVEKFRKPAIVFARDVDQNGTMIYKGSGRSVEGVNLIECLADCSLSMVKFGGHAMAAGMTVLPEKIVEFKQLFDNRVHLVLAQSVTLALKDEDIFESSVDEVMNPTFLEFFTMLEPFGPQNEKPVFFDKEAMVVSCRAIGSEGRHLQLTLRGKYANHKAVAFGLGDRLEDVQRNRVRQIRFTPMLNKYRRQSSWQVNVLAI